MQAELQELNRRITDGHNKIWTEEERVRSAGGDPNQSPLIGSHLRFWQKLVDRSHELIDAGAA